MSDNIPNPFEGLSEQDRKKEIEEKAAKMANASVDRVVKKRGRPKMKNPIGQGKTAKAAVGKTKRKPVGLRGVSETPLRKGFKRRWVTDKEDRVKMFLEGGYSPVKNEKGDVRMRRSGSGLKDVLMEIDEDIYNEDQEAKYAKWNKDNQERLTPREGAGFYQPGTKR